MAYNPNKWVQDRNNQQNQNQNKQPSRLYNLAAEIKKKVEQEKIRNRIAGYIPKPIESVAEQGPKEIRDVLAQRKSALAGYEAPELAAMQAQAALAQQGGETQRQRALEAALAKQGVRGGAASALQAQAAQMAAREKAALGQEMLLKQEERQRGALSEYEKGALQSLGLGQQRQFMEVATKLAGEQMLSAENIAALQAEAQKYYGEQMKQAQQGVSACCFIFLEADDGVINRIARRARDELMTDKNCRGYYKLSEVLVPLMRRYSSIKFMVKWGMVRPMIFAGKWKYGENKLGKLCAPIAHFWLNLFDYLGGDHPFMRENGEVI